MIKSMSAPLLERHTITMSTENSAGVRDRVGPRGFSAYVDHAVAQQLRRDELADLVADLAELNGPVDEQAVAEIMGTLWT